jgi:FlaA1/EpsC-like NDP-sugar epimerase
MFIEMSYFQYWKKLFRPTIDIRNFLSAFFYYIAKSITISKIRSHGRLIASSFDLCAVAIAWLFAYWVLIDTMASMTITSLDKTKSILSVSYFWEPVFSNLLWILPCQFILFRFFGLYRGFWRFASVQDLRKILYVSLLGGFIAWLVLRMNTEMMFSVSISNSAYLKTSHLVFLPKHIFSLLYSFFLVALLSSARLSVRFAKNYKQLYGDYQRVIIIGAGNAGEGLVRDLLRDESQRYKPVAFLDDDPAKLGREIHNVRVIGTIVELPKFIEKYDIDLVLIAIPSASSASMRSVFEVCGKSKIRCYTLPGLKDLANGRVSINILRSVSLEDLLGRYPVTCQWSSIQAHLKNKTILVTGGGGSIGSELCRQIISLGNNTRLIIMDSNEYNLYSIDMELRQKFPSYELHPILLNVTDRIGLQSIFQEYQPHLVFHAAAYKHVPMLENQPRVAIFNNIVGTATVAEEALKSGVETFILISSDKAVNPTNVMGATKRAAEYFCQSLNNESGKTNFITVRFGNVLDSAGSVIPLFRKQIESGGPVTVTHPEIIRFFMTIPEASQLILQAAFLGQGGETFVLDMGDPIKISYLAEQMIKLAGKTVDKDIKIVYTGLRPGEKLYEECFYSDEMLQPTVNAKILKAQSKKRDFSEIQDNYKQIEDICIQWNDENYLALLRKLVPEYNPAPSSNNFSQKKVKDKTARIPTKTKGQMPALGLYSENLQ